MGLYLCLSLATVSVADEAVLIDNQCSLATATNDRNTLQTLEPWFVHEQHQNLHGYKQHITELESQTGAYAYQLGPTLISLGLLQQEAGEHDEAAKAFQRALHIIRINDGLYSPKQLPLLELLIETNSAIDEWREVANNHDMMYWLYKRNYHMNDPTLLPVIKRLRRWHIEAYNKSTDRSLAEHFDAADELQAHAVDIIRTCTGDKQEARCLWHRACCSDGPKDRQCPLDQ